MRLIVEIEDGMLTGVYTDADLLEVDGLLIDHDQIEVGEEGVYPLDVYTLDKLAPDSQTLVYQHDHPEVLPTEPARYRADRQVFEFGPDYQYVKSTREVEGILAKLDVSRQRSPRDGDLVASRIMSLMVQCDDMGIVEVWESPLINPHVNDLFTLVYSRARGALR